MHSSCVRFGIAQPLEYPPKLAIPESWDHIYFDHTTSRFDHDVEIPSNSYDAFKYACRLCGIDSGILAVLHDPSVTRPASLGFAYSRYAKVLETMGNIPENLQRTSKAPASVLYLQ